MNDYKRLATSILITIDAVALLVMLFAGLKVYKIDKFKNRFIVFMMVFIILSISFDLANWILTKKKMENDTHEGTLRLHDINMTLDLLTGTSMIIALQLNLRIWFVYLLKIGYIGKTIR